MKKIESIILLGSSYPSARPYIYELSKLNLNIYTADSNYQIINILSLRVKKHIRISEDESIWLNFFINLATSFPNTMIIPTLPKLLYFCLENKSILSKYYTLACETSELNCLLDNRISSIEVAKSVNLLSPSYFKLKNNDDAELISNQLDYFKKSYILKFNIPDIYLLKDLERCTIDAGASIEEFREILKGIHITETNPLIIQEFIPGPVENLIGVSMFCDSNSDPILIYSTKRIKEYPTSVKYVPFDLRLGKTVCYEEYYDDEAINYGIKIAKKLNIKGLLFIEFKRSIIDNKLYFIKFQTRCKDVMIISKKLKQSLYILHYKYYAELPIFTETYIYEKQVWIWVLDYFKSVPFEKKLISKISTILIFLKLIFFRKINFAYFYWHDPLPFFGSSIAKLTCAKKWYKYVLK